MKDITQPHEKVLISIHDYKNHDILNSRLTKPWYNNNMS